MHGDVVEEMTQVFFLFSDDIGTEHSNWADAESFYFSKSS